MKRIDLPHFETTTCGRCGGSGHYSYCLRYGTTCFGCSGSGKKLTKRAAVARAFEKTLLDANSIAVEDVTPGMWIHTGDKWIRPGKVERGEHYVTLTTSKSAYNMFPGTKVRVGLSEEKRRAIREEALQYQATLTKQGKVSKRKAK